MKISNFVFAFLFAITCMTTGCSGSSEPPTTALQPPTDPPASEEYTDGDDQPLDDQPVLGSTLVTFDITVPAYQSNALQVRLVWGVVDLTANWIGDEFWSISAELPTNTEQLLTITFYDNNGELALGSFEQTYRTGNNATESYQVLADQFDTDRWDDDGDSISNLDELLLGTDPLTFENIDLEIRDSVTVDESVFMTEMFSRTLPAERPYTLNWELSELPEGCEPNCAYFRRNIHTIAIYIDTNGNGTIEDFHEKGSLAAPANIAMQANRAISGNSINWEGSWRHFAEYRDGWVTRIPFTNAVAEIDADLRSYIGSSSRWSGADYRQASSSSEHNIIGKIIESTTLCEPVAGSIMTSTYNESGFVNTTEITRNMNDPFWTVSVMHTEDSTLSDVYFAKSLTIRIWQDEEWDDIGFPVLGYEENGKFNCDLADLQ